MIDTLTFGIEIECTLPRNEQTSTIQIGGRHSGIQLPGFPEGWNAQADGSIRATRSRYGVEIVSPVLRGGDGVRQIIEVCRKLATLGARVNPSCGFHVHVGFDRSNVDGLKRLISLVANVEPGIWAATGTKSRERGQWCASTRGGFRGMNANAEDVRTLAPTVANRYQLLNVSNLVYGTKPTVEFRAFGGTLNAGKVIAYVRLCLAVVERALTETHVATFEPKPVAAGSPMRRKGNGYTEVTRLLYAIGWTKGRRPRAYGALGIGEGMPSMDASKAELRRLAKKYDTQP